MNRFFAVVLISIAITSCNLVERTHQSFFNYLLEWVPLEVDEKVGQAMRAQILSKKPVLSDPSVDQQLSRMIAPLVSQASESGFRFSIALVDDASVNAFALPGGFIYVHSGLIDKVESAEELLGVLAHELAHVTQRHSMQGIVTTFGIRLIAIFLLQELEGLGDILVQGGAHLASLSFSRLQEREADDQGWSFLVGAGMDPRGMITFFERLLPAGERQALAEENTLESRQRGLGQKLSKLEGPLRNMTRTHPSTADRIMAMRHHLTSWDGTFQPVNIDFIDFQNAVRRLGRIPKNEG